MAHIKKPDGYIPKSKLTVKPVEHSQPVSSEASPESSTQTLELYHSVTSVINTALNTLGTELAKLRVKSANSMEPLDEKQLKALNDFLKTAITYEAHQAALARQAELTGKLSEMSDEELLKLVNSTLAEDESKSDKPKSSRKKSAENA